MSYQLFFLLCSLGIVLHVLCLFFICLKLKALSETLDFLTMEAKGLEPVKIPEPPPSGSHPTEVDWDESAEGRM